MPFLIISLVLLALIFGPGVWVGRVINRYSTPADRYPGTGAELARLLLDRNGLNGVRVEETEQGDHYDPRDKTVRLTPDKFAGRSLTAITVAAHEVGHALQDHTGYGPLVLRTRLVQVIEPIQKIGAGVLMISPFIAAITRAPGLSVIAFLAGMATLLSSTVVHFVTLPTELDASFARALPMLEKEEILKEVDKPHARRLLKAAALTYVSASLTSLLNIARWWAILRR